MEVIKHTFIRDERDVCLLDLLPQIYHPIQDFQAMSNLSSEEVEELYSGVDYILDNAFINSASETTIAKWEGYLNITPNGTDTLDERKFRVLAKLNDNPPYTDRYLVNKLTELCGGTDNFRITRDYLNYRLTIEISLNSIANTNTIAEVVASIIPANLELIVNTALARHYELEPYTHEHLGNYTQDQIRYRAVIDN